MHDATSILTKREPPHASATHASVCIEGTELHWAELGEATDLTPVVLLHGLNDSHLSWKAAAPALAADRRVLMPDLPGHGLSERPNASYALGWHAHMMAKWLEALGLESVDIVGHSFGGGVAQSMLLECPERIRRLVLVAPGGLGRQVTAALRLASMPRVVELFGQPFMALGTRMVLRSTLSGLSKQDLAERSRMNGMPGSARAFARTVRDVIDWRGQRRAFFDRSDELTELPPIAVCWGDRDAIIPFAHGRAFTELVDGVVLEQFEGCGHYPHGEQPHAFARAVHRFLDDPAIAAARLRGKAPREAVIAPRAAALGCHLKARGRSFEELPDPRVERAGRA